MELKFEDFKKMAMDKKMSVSEKVGFPDGYRDGLEQHIVDDISIKLKLDLENINVLDIGCGCSSVVNNLVNKVQGVSGRITLIDSEEMLSNLDLISLGAVSMLPGRFLDVKEQLTLNSFDSILVYSVLQYIYNSENVYNFIHNCLDLLKPGGRLLLGDIPNYDSRQRFLTSRDGLEFLKNKDVVDLGRINIDHQRRDRMDDTIVLSILAYFRNYGFEVYLVPQGDKLPFANRREDILVIKR